jgi:uncharacterized protein YigE (DUF2233 family)
MEDKQLKFRNPFLVFSIISLCLVFFMHVNAGKYNGNSRQFPETIKQPDTFQLLLNQYSAFLKNTGSKEKKRKEFQNLLEKIHNASSRINGSRRLVYKNTNYLVFVANLDSDEIRMHLFDKEHKNFHSLGAVRNNISEQNRKALMITNAGMFTRDYEPEGLYIEGNSNVFSPLDTLQNIPEANFYLKPNGVFYIDANKIPHIDTTEKLARTSLKELRTMKVATQSGPMLVINGIIHKAFIPGSKNTKIRSGVGLMMSNSKKVVFAITETETNFYDFASFYRDIFNCENALFLDGVISEMYLHDLNPNNLGGSFGPMISVSRKN